MVVGDGIPGDRKTAELCARCCNVAYGHALEDAVELLKIHGIDASLLVNSLKST